MRRRPPPISTKSQILSERMAAIDKALSKRLTSNWTGAECAVASDQAHERALSRQEHQQDLAQADQAHQQTLAQQDQVGQQQQAAQAQQAAEQPQEPGT